MTLRIPAIPAPITANFSGRVTSSGSLTGGNLPARSAAGRGEGPARPRTRERGEWSHAAGTFADTARPAGCNGRPPGTHRASAGARTPWRSSMSVTAMHERERAQDDGACALRAEILDVGRRWSTAQDRLIHLVVELDDSGFWRADGARTCAHWVADALDIEVSTAREWLRIGRRLTELPTIGEAFAEGRVSYSKVRTLTRVATPENEAELEAIAESVPAGRLAHAVAAWLMRHETPEETDA